MNIVEKSVTDLRGYKKNNKSHPAKQVQMIADSITQFGFRNPIIIDKNNEIIAGHGRLLGAKQLGMETVPCIIADDLTEDQVRAYRLLDNRIGDFGEYDIDSITEELKDIGNLQLGLNSLDDLFTDLLPEKENEEVKEDDFEVDDQIKTDIVLGDLFEIGEHRLLCGDSTDSDSVAKLMNGEKADMVFTDPPYGISFEDTKGNKIQNDDLQDDALMKFNDTFQKIAYNVSKDDCFMIVWQSPRLFHLLNFFGEWRFFRLITLYKSNRISFPHGAWINKTEPGLVFVKGKPKISKEKYTDDCFVYTHDKESHDDSNVGHPTPKPPILAENNILSCTGKGELVLDLFLGSGTTMVASHRHGRKCYGMELDPKYCQVIIDRMIKIDPTLEIKKNGLPYNQANNG